MTTTKEIAGIIRKQFKEKFGLTNKDVSVKKRHYSSVDVSLKSPRAIPHMKEIRSLCKGHETIHYCQMTQEILCGGNTFVFVQYDRDLHDHLEKRIFEEINKQMKPEFGQLENQDGQNSITVFDNFQVFKIEDSGKNYYSIRDKSEPYASVGRCYSTLTDLSYHMVHFVLESDSIGQVYETYLKN